MLTCTPWPAFANNHVIQWQVVGLDTLGNPLTGATTGSFTNIVGVNGGSGTNAFTFFQVVHYTFYEQTTSSPPVLLPNITYEFFAQTLLSSNRTATNITVTIPVRLAVSNLVEDLLSPERFSVSDFNPNLLATFTTNFPSGNYIFNVSAVDSNQQVTVDLPAYVPPNSPQVSNYVAAQSVNPSQPFTLNWITFTNGLSTDWILFQIDWGSHRNPFPDARPRSIRRLERHLHVGLDSGQHPVSQFNQHGRACLLSCRRRDQRHHSHPGRRRECDLLHHHHDHECGSRIGAGIDHHAVGNQCYFDVADQCGRFHLGVRHQPGFAGVAHQFPGPGRGQHQQRRDQRHHRHPEVLPVKPVKRK